MDDGWGRVIEELGVFKKMTLYQGLGGVPYTLLG